MNMKATLKGMSKNDLEDQKTDVENRIQRLKNHLMAPLDQDLSEQAPQLSNRIIFNSLMETENAMLAEIRKLLVNR